MSAYYLFNSNNISYEYSTSRTSTRSVQVQARWEGRVLELLVAYFFLKRDQISTVRKF